MLKARLRGLLLIIIIASLTGCGWSSKVIPEGTNWENDANTATAATSAATSATSATIATSGQYDLKCTYLKNPEAVIALVDKSAAFWKNSIDYKNGGYFTEILRDGKVVKKTNIKVAFMQSRNAYGFVRAYQLTGRKEYLDYARKGLDFIYKYAWDNKNGGWYQDMNIDGTLAPRTLDGMPWNSMKSTFNQMNVLSGISAMYEATRNKNDEAWLNKAYSNLDEKVWDRRPGYEGYYEKANANWTNLSYKGIVEANEAIPTHAETMYLLGIDDKYKKRMLAVADNINDYIVKSMAERKFGINDRFDSDWNKTEGLSSTHCGNFLTPAWCLARAYLVEGKPEYKAGAEKLINEILYSQAYDKTYGGFYSYLDPNTGAPMGTKKSWWIISRSLTSGLTAYYITGNTAYLKMADESMDFYMKHIYDQQYGDAYSEVNRDGSNPDTVKGRYWKDNYHTFELFYYTYLYGNLMLKEKPVSLYYYIEAVGEDREITLMPVALGDKKLVIKSVTLDGREYGDFEGSQLKLPADTGGEFKVTFGIRN